jgi:hypothetical protein
MMNEPARRVRHCGIGEYRDEAEALLSHPGDTATVIRGRVRSVLIKCPDGCGDTLVINLDRRAGKAWAIDTRKQTTTLFPSVWREDGCKSHFIVWRDHILWCGRFDEGNSEPSYDRTLEPRLLDALDRPGFRSALDVAEEIDEIPWEVLRAFRRLAVAKQVEEGAEGLRQHFRRKG